MRFNLWISSNWSWWTTIIYIFSFRFALLRTPCNLLTAFGYINGIYSPYHRLLRYHTTNEKEQKKNRLLSLFFCLLRIQFVLCISCAMFNSQNVYIPKSLNMNMWTTPKVGSLLVLFYSTPLYKPYKCFDCSFVINSVQSDYKMYFR